MHLEFSNQSAMLYRHRRNEVEEQTSHPLPQVMKGTCEVSPGRPKALAFPFSRYFY